MPDKIEIYYERDGSQKILLNGQALESLVGFDINERFDELVAYTPWERLPRRSNGVEVTLHLRVPEVRYYNGAAYEGTTPE
jgi:hypothetical protein